MKEGIESINQTFGGRSQKHSLVAGLRTKNSDCYDFEHFRLFKKVGFHYFKLARDTMRHSATF